jgi:Phasin protein
MGVERSKENVMATGTEQFFDAWKKQVETSVRMMDAVVEAMAKMRSAQLSSANETHECAQALKKALADAKDARELWTAQWNWALASCERSAAYWRSLFEAMTQANGALGHCVQEGMQGAVPAPSGDGIGFTGLAAMDNAYREMLNHSQQLLQYAAGTFNAPAASGSARTSETEKAA